MRNRPVLLGMATCAVAALMVAAGCSSNAGSSSAPSTSTAPAPASATTTPAASAPSSSTTPPTETSSTVVATPTLSGVELGKMIYHNGAGNAGTIVEKGGSQPCASCHGTKASGGAGPDIRGKALKKGGYKESTFARAVTKGLDEGGGKLEKKMPRFGATAEETQALWDYLQTLK